MRFHLFDRPRKKLGIYEVAERNRQELLAGEDLAVRKLEAAWRLAEREIRRKLDALVSTIAQAQSSGVSVSPSWLFQQYRLTEYLAAVRSEIQRFGNTAAEVSVAQQSAAIVLGVDHAAALMESAGIGAGFVRMPADQFQQLVGFLSDGSPLKELFQQIGPGVAAKASQTLLQQVALGVGPRKIAVALSNSTGIVRDRALLIARTESLRAYRTAQIANYGANSDVLAGWRWTSARDDRTCPICIAMDGTEHPLGEQFHSHPACRCAPTPIVKYVPVDRGTGEEWLRQQPESVQIEKLGPGRYALWKDGQASLADMVEATDHPRWGGGLKLRPIKELTGR